MPKADILNIVIIIVTIHHHHHQWSYAIEQVFGILSLCLSSQSSAACLSAT